MPEEPAASVLLPPELLSTWFRVVPGRRTVRNVIEEIERCLVELDNCVERQLNAIIHHPKYQQMEAAWRGLEYLVSQTPVPEGRQELNSPPVRILIYSVTWDDLADDLTGAIEFDSSYLFRRVYTEHYGQAGGQPIGLLIGNYELEPNQTTCDVLEAISSVAAAAFCPFVTGVSPEFWGVSSFAELQHPDLIRLASHPPRIPQAAWDALRRREDTRFIGLAVPRVLLRRPYGNQSYGWVKSGHMSLLRFKEDSAAPDCSGLLWGTAAWTFGEVAIREYIQSRWFGEMLAVEALPGETSYADPEMLPHGMVVGLAQTSFSSDRESLQPKPSSDLFIDESLEQLFIELGFLALSRCPGGPFSAFYSAPSLQISKVYDRQQATENAKLSASLDAMLCVSRFAHYLKLIGRNWLGSLTSAEEIEESLHNWLMEYVSNDSAADADPERRAESPLTDASVKVAADPGKHGAFKCQIHLRPRLTPDGLVASIRLTTDLISPDAASSQL